MSLCDAISKRVITLCQERQISKEDLQGWVNADRDMVRAVIKGQDQLISLDLLDNICFALGTTRVGFFEDNLSDVG